MLDPKLYHDIISGRRRGIGARVAKATLAAARVPYAAAVFVRNRRYDQAHAATRVAAPVVSVGNLTLGGTGKTPMIAWLAGRLRDAGRRPVIISRGYGTAKGRRNDESLELEQQLGDVPHLQNPDRVEAAKVAIDELQSDIILLDDGFQHRRLHRDLDIVLLDALSPFGHERLFPGGTLREPVTALRRADAVVLTRADLISSEQREWIRRHVHQAAPHVTWATARHAARELVSSAGMPQPLDLIRNQPIAAFCGIGNPRGFRHTLAAIPVRVVAFREFPDHHDFARGDLATLDSWAQATDAVAIVCTRKDIVKIGRRALGEKPLWAVGIEIEMTAGETALGEKLAFVAAKRSARER